MLLWLAMHQGPFRPVTQLALQPRLTALGVHVAVSGLTVLWVWWLQCIRGPLGTN